MTGINKVKTLNNYTMSPADICRTNGWKVGDIIEGNEGYGCCRLLLTAIGETNIFAKCLSHENYERSWSLQKGEWCKIDSTRLKIDKTAC